MKRTILLVIVLAFMLFTLTGCVTAQYNLKINKDKTGEVEYVYALDKSVLESLNTTAREATLEMREKVVKNNYKVEDYEDEKSAGFRATKHIDDVTEENILEEMFGEKYIKNIEESKVKVKKTLFGNKYNQKAIVNLESVDSLAQITVKLEYTLNIPTKVGKNNADEISKDGKTITWKFKPGEEREIYFYADSGRMLKMIILVIIAIIIITAIVIYIFKHLKNNKKSNTKINKNKKK